MIGKNTKVCIDCTKIENYEKAVADETQMWHCHHRLETHFSDGTPRPKNVHISRAELMALDMYFDRPPEELIFLTKKDHFILHGRSASVRIKKVISQNRGRKRSEESKRKISKTLKGRKQSEEIIRKRVEKLKGHTVSEETRKKISEALKGRISPMLGKQLSEETKIKMSLAKKGKTSNKKGLHWRLENEKRIYF